MAFPNNIKITFALSCRRSRDMARFAWSAVTRQSKGSALVRRHPGRTLPPLQVLIAICGGKGLYRYK